MGINLMDYYKEGEEILTEEEVEKIFLAAGYVRKESSGLAVGTKVKIAKVIDTDNFTTEDVNKIVGSTGVIVVMNKELDYPCVVQFDDNDLNKLGFYDWLEDELEVIE